MIESSKREKEKKKKVKRKSLSMKMLSKRESCQVAVDKDIINVQVCQSFENHLI